MGKVTGFMELDRVESDYQPVEDRIKHFKEFLIPLDQKKVSEQGSLADIIRHEEQNFDIQGDNIDDDFAL